MPEASTDKVVQLLDLVLEFFAAGSNWIRGGYHDGHGRRCLVGAVEYLGRKHHLPSGAVLSFLQEAMPNRRCPPVYFNDRHCRSVAELRSVIVKARVLAVRESEQRPERERIAAAVERWLLAEVEQERAARAAGDVRVTYTLCRCPPARIAA